MEEQTVDTDSTIEDRIGALFGEDEAVEEQEEQAEEQELDAEEAEDSSEEFEPVEFNGKEYQVPKEIKEVLEKSGSMQADYTKKTQDLAERSRIIESQERASVERQQFEQAVAGELETLRNLDIQLQQIQNIDWSSLDTDQMLRYRHALDQVKEQRGQLNQQLQQKYALFQNNIQRHQQEMLSRGYEYLHKAIPNWGEQTQTELNNYGVNEGYSPHELMSVIDPRMIKTLWKAQQYDKLVSQKGVAQQRAKNAPPVIKPGKSDPSNQRFDKHKYKQEIRRAKTGEQKKALIADRVSHFNFFKNG